MKQFNLVELALEQVDALGFELQRRGITQKINRHTIVASALVAKDRVLGERRRLDLVIARQKNRLKMPKAFIASKWDAARAFVPDPVRSKIDRLIF